MIYWHELNKLKKTDREGQAIFNNLYISMKIKERYIEIMVKIDHNFAAYYYLNEDGTIYNSKEDKIIKPDSKHIFILRTEDNKRKKIALKTIYKLIYHKNYCIDVIQDLEGEEWKEIDNTDKQYYISNRGRIKSLYGYNSIILKPFHNKKGYARVDIVIDGKRSTKLVHRLVAAAFLPLPQKIDMQLHHKDFDKDQNAADNLEWLDPIKHREKHRQHNKGAKKDVSTKPEEDIDRKNQ